MSGAARALVGNARWGAACASVGPCASQTASRLNRFAYIAAGVTLEDGVFIGPHAVFTDDRVPRAVNPNLSLKTRANWVEGQTLVREGAAVGASASVVCGVTIGRWAIVGAGAVVARDVPDFAKVAGSPACIIGYVCRCGNTVANPAAAASCPDCGAFETRPS
jgi:UDP-2-acetamido-3-amino-2,3-dideoxy-glucuronate N-acetyltransferase